MSHDWGPSGGGVDRDEATCRRCGVTLTMAEISRLDYGAEATCVASGIENYTVGHYTDGDYYEAESYRKGQLRDDQFNAIRYALGHYAYLPSPHELDGQPFAVAVAELEMLRKTSGKRSPELILTVGSGRGELEAALTELDIPYIAIDPSPGAAALTPLTVQAWTGMRANFRRIALGQVVNKRWWPDTIIVNETLEHIHEAEWNTAWSWIRQRHPLLVITNQISYHPIGADSDWNHVRTIDDDVYDQIASKGETMFRQGSHLVVQL